MSSSFRSYSSSESLTSDDCGDLKPITLNKSQCKIHPSHVIKTDVCSRCGSSRWVQILRTINIGIGMFVWGKAPKLDTVKVCVGKYCHGCNADYDDAAIVTKVWKCCGKNIDADGCTSSDMDDLAYVCVVDE